jgi:hypothetical protein
MNINIKITEQQAQVWREFRANVLLSGKDLRAELFAIIAKYLKEGEIK